MYNQTEWINNSVPNATRIDVDNTLLCFPQEPDSCLRTPRFFILRVSMYIFMLPTVLMTILGNLLVIMTISHFKQLHSPTNFIILSLAVVDTLLGSMIMPFSMVRWVEGCWFLGEIFCKIHSSLDMTLSIVSILHLCLVSIDRYMAITDPLGYKMKVTNESVLVCIGVICLFSFSFSFGVVLSNINLEGLDELVILTSCLGNCSLIFNRQWGVIASLVAFFIPGAVMSCLYLKIFHVARRQVKIMSERAGKTETNHHTSEQRERKAAKTLGIVMGIFLFCWLPFFLATIADPFMDFSTPVDVFNALVWFGYLNSTCNPLVYGFFYPRFQKAFKIIISKYVFHNPGNLTL